MGRLEPQLNAYRTVRADKARREAVDAQRRIDTGERLPLLGVAVAIKDDIDVAGELTAWGTAAHGPIKECDAEVVRRLRAAGAIVIGKTNVPEMTIWPFTESPTFGPTRNPWDPSRSPGGSSGGTAAAVAAGLAPFGVGSDGGGSIRTPATWCGTYGLKPQRDRVPMTPHDDGWQGLIVNGPITRTVEDAALFLDVTTSVCRHPKGLRRRRSSHSPSAADRGQHDQPARHPRARRDRAASRRHRGRRLAARARPRRRRMRPGLRRRCPSGWHITARYLRGIHDDVATIAHPERLERRSRVDGASRPPRLRQADRHRSRRRDAHSQRVNAIFDDVDVVVTPGTADRARPVSAHSPGAEHSSPSARPWVAHRSRPSSTPPVNPPPSSAWGIDATGLPTSIQLVGRPSDEATLLALSTQIEISAPMDPPPTPIS
ncbi:MAG: amidase family protein [Ilumatobacteraceae bacterium]